ncbi:MAG: (Na+)-NQR maturation NqrM [Cardiobacteriaceae bacterium]|nr:(Na+)-NQR maturation NqrM [Cardiobacteriaceae bacterium]
METFIAIFVLLLVAVAGMSVGVIFGRAPLKGSCGGLGAVGVEKACGCTDGCDQEKASSSSTTSTISIYR